MGKKFAIPSDRPGSLFERCVAFGFFNLAALLAFVPISLICDADYPLLLALLGNFRPLSFCGFEGDYFFNADWLLGFLLSWILFNGIESLCRSLIARQSTPELLVAWLRSLPLLVLCLSSRALPEARPIYWLLAGLGLFFAFNPALGFPRLFSRRGVLVYLGWGLLNSLMVFVWLGGIGSASCEKATWVRANMHALQTLVETYFVETGRYPIELLDLKKAADKAEDPYWKDFFNPFTGGIGSGKAYDDFSRQGGDAILHVWDDYGGIRFYRPRREGAGLVLYRYLDAHHYEIYGLAYGGYPVQYNRHAYFLTNE